MSPRTIDIEAQPVAAPPKAAGSGLNLPLCLTLGGYALLLIAIVLPLGAFGSMAAVLIGAAVLTSGHILVPAVPYLLLLPHLAVIVYLGVQLGGLCRLQCGDFGVYAHIAAVPTVVVGIGFHLICLLGLWLGLRTSRPQLIRMAAGAAQGTSLFFAFHLVLAGHWCPSCAASHAAMLAQGIILLRLTPMPHLQRFWFAMIAVGFLATNLVFHHREPAVPLQAGDRLLGFLQSAARTGMLRQVMVAPAANLPQAVIPSLPVRGPVQTTLPQAERTPPPVKSDPTTVGILAQGPVPRAMDFDVWGHAEAPLTVKMSMSLVCPHCREHWPVLSQALRGRIAPESASSTNGQTAQALAPFLGPRIRAGAARLQFVLNWPLQPESHHGARLATFVTYAAGSLGEDELFAALETFFSTRGLLLMQNVNQQLLASETHGRISPEVENEALVALIQAVEGIEPQRLAAAYRAEKGLIDARLKTNIDWLLLNGNLETPRYYFLSGDPSGPAILDASTLDPEVWKAFITKASTP